MKYTINLPLFFLYILFCFDCSSVDDTLILKNNLTTAQVGDYIVISSNKTETLMHIYDKQGRTLTIEEIAVPENKRKQCQLGWKEWVLNNAPGNTSWVIYDIDIDSGAMLNYFSFTKNNWFEIPDADNFLSKLLNLKFQKIPEKLRKKIGPRTNSGGESRHLWQPRMVLDGKVINGILFDAWKTRWPKDSTDLSNKTIEIYLPKEDAKYPSYFPYWLQISGLIGKAKIRMIDSGRNLKSPKTKREQHIVSTVPLSPVKIK